MMLLINVWQIVVFYIYIYILFNFKVNEKAGYGLIPLQDPLARVSCSALTSRSAGHQWPGGSWRCWTPQLGPPPRTALRPPQPSSVWRHWRWRRKSRNLHLHLHLQAAAGCSTGASPRALATLRGFAAADRAVGDPSCSHWEGSRWNCCRRGVGEDSSWWQPGGTHGSPNILRVDAAQQLDVQQNRMTRLLFFPSAMMPEEKQSVNNQPGALIQNLD